MKKWLLFSCLMAVIACKNKRQSIGDSLFPEMPTIDSIQVLFYDKEDEDRFFTYTIETDSVRISTIVEDIRYDTIPVTNCTRQGKVYCFKGGEIYNTVYFNMDCAIPHFRYIHHARLFTFSMSSQSRKLLQEWRSAAVAP